MSGSSMCDKGNLAVFDPGGGYILHAELCLGNEAYDAEGSGQRTAGQGDGEDKHILVNMKAMRFVTAFFVDGAVKQERAA